MSGLTLRQRMRAAASILTGGRPPSRMLAQDDEIDNPPVENIWAVIVQLPGGPHEALFMAYHAQDGGWRPYQTTSPAEVDDLRAAALLWTDVEGPRLVLRRFVAQGTDEVIRP